MNNIVRDRIVMGPRNPYTRGIPQVAGSLLWILCSYLYRQSSRGGSEEFRYQLQNQAEASINGVAHHFALNRKIKLILEQYTGDDKREVSLVPYPTRKFRQIFRENTAEMFSKLPISCK